ncbi:hypothetical protein CP532_0286 [Ophiocordyceps camponoti-leonardi (nom. inval.)]|nr:hypothetical protein CP532_0286 [Ophiocordyceps camponoti-leonardi (nom. inval.)]
MRNLKIISTLLLTASSTCRASLPSSPPLYRRDEKIGEYGAHLEEANKYLPLAIKCYQDFLPRLRERNPPRQEALDSIYLCDKDYNLTTKALKDAGKLAVEHESLTDKLFSNKLADVTDTRTSMQGPYTQKLQASREQLEKVSNEAGEAFKNGTEALKKVMDVLNDLPDVPTKEIFESSKSNRTKRSIDVTKAKVEISKNSDGSLVGSVVGLIVAGVVITVGFVTAQPFLDSFFEVGLALEAAASTIPQITEIMAQIEAVPVEELSVGQLAKAAQLLRDARETAYEAAEALGRVRRELFTVPGNENVEARLIFAARQQEVRNTFIPVFEFTEVYERLTEQVFRMISSLGP